MMTRQIEEKDLPELLTWFQDRKWPTPPVEDAGPKIGFVLEEGEHLFACIWLYMTGTSKAYMDWIGTNPKLSGPIAMESIKKLINDVVNVVMNAEPKVRVLEFITQSDKLAEKFEGLSFKRTRGFNKLQWVAKESP